MKKPIQTRTIFLGLCIMSIFIISACSQNIKETNKYYNPAWMADGKIICVHSYEKVAIGSSSSGIYGSSGGTILAQNNYLTVIDPTTNIEHNILDLEWDNYPVLNCSPKGTYLAMQYGGIVIYQLSNMQKINTITVNERIRKFDWSPDEKKIIIRSNNKINIYKINGEITNQINNITSFEGWKYNEYIIGYTKIAANTVSIKLITSEDKIITSNTEIGDAGQFFPDGKSCYGYFKKISVLSFNVVETYNNLETELEKKNGFIISINPSKPNEIMYCTNFNINPDYYNNIILINLDGTNKRTIR